MFIVDARADLDDRARWCLVNRRLDGFVDTLNPVVSDIFIDNQLHL